MGDSAGRAGASLKRLNELQAEYEQVYGNTAAYRAIAGNPVSSRAIAGGRALAGAVTPATDLAGAMSNLAKAQEAAAKDFANLSHVLADPNATLAQRLIASARAGQSGAAFVQRQQAFVGSLSAADRAYLERSGMYAKVTAPARPGVQMLGRMNGSALQTTVKAVSVVGAAAGTVVSAIALPDLLKGTADAGRRLANVIDDPTVSEDEKLGAIADTARGGSGVVMALNGIRTGVSTMIGVARESSLLGAPVGRMAGTSLAGNLGKVIGGVFKILLPIADAGMLVADSVKLRTVWRDPAATGMDKARAVLAVGLGVVKIATYLLPQTLLLRTAYMVASLGQLALASVDLGHALIPTFKKVGVTLVEAVKNPGEALRKAGAAIKSGIASLGAWLRQLGAPRAGISAQDAGKSWFERVWDNGKEALASGWHVAEASASLV
ncbi:MAG: hypothetical protein FJZ01_28240, partial [Candidatus Sericytochromatia bacterium]|nr:hypothetical protein [Candidatus Tanganyikabacteria bacterium]